MFTTCTSRYLHRLNLLKGLVAFLGLSLLFSLTLWRTAASSQLPYTKNRKGVSVDSSLRNSPTTNFVISGRVADSNNNGIGNVRVSLTGLGGATSIDTDGNGNYSFTVTGGGNYTITATRSGFDFTPPQISRDNLSATETGANFLGAVVPVPSQRPVRADDFNANNIDRNRWNLGITSELVSSFDPLVSVTQGSSADPNLTGRLRIAPRTNTSGPSFNGSVSALPMNLSRQTLISVRCINAATGPTAATIFGVGKDTNNFSRIVVTSVPLSQLGIATTGPNAPKILNRPTDGSPITAPLAPHSQPGRETFFVQTRGGGLFAFSM